MIPLSEIDTWLCERFAGLLAEHRIPGAAIAVAVGDDVVEHAAGVLSTATGVEVTTDSVFQIGSITKLWTADLVMQLVEEGRLDLGAPVRRYLPGFRVADEAASAVITVRQLLTHTSGFAGDIFTDTGRNDDAVERYVDRLDDVEQVYPPGEMFSYNNAGYVVLGRIVEVLRDKPFAVCLQEGLIEPLGLTHAVLGAERAILFRAAVGHLTDRPDAEFRPAPVWNLPSAHAPAGSLLAMPPRELLAFARMHLRGGIGPQGSPVVSAETAAAVLQPQVNLPRLALVGDAWGLGWELQHGPTGTVVGHTGGTLGQSAVLRIVPAADLSVALLMNGGDVTAASREIVGFLLRELAGVELRPLDVPPAGRIPVDPARYAGEYSSPAADVVVSADDAGRVWLDQRPKGIFAEFGAQPEPVEIVRLDGDTFLMAEATEGVHRAVVFVGDDGRGNAQYLHGGRASRRVAGKEVAGKEATGKDGAGKDVAGKELDAMMPGL